MASRTFKRAAIAIGVLVLVAGAASLYLFNADLTWTRGPLVRAASKAIGRQLAVAGPYHLRLGKTIELSAGGITLANAPWAENPHLVSVKHLDVELSTASLFRGPVHILRLTARDVEINLEQNANGTGNWEKRVRKPAAKPTSPRELPVLNDLRLDQVRATYRAPGRPVPLVLELPVAHLSEAADGVVDLDLRGILDGKTLRLAGRLGPIGQIAGGEPFRQDLQFRLGTVEGRFAGRTASLRTLAGASLDLSLHGPKLGELTTLLGAGGTGRGPFSIKATTRPAGPAINARLHAETSLLKADASGTILPGGPPTLDLHVTATGEDLDKLTALGGLSGFPPVPFSVEGELRSHGFPVTVSGLTVRAGRTSLSVDGSLGRPPGLDGTDASLKLHAPDTSLISRLTHLQLPRGTLSARGRITVEGKKVVIHGLDASIGNNHLRTDGTIRGGTKKPGAAFTIDAGGPDLSAFDGLAGTPLPHGPFRAAGRIVTTGKGIRLESAGVDLGGNRIEASGTLSNAGDRAGSELDLSVTGPNPTLLASLAGIRGLPAAPFHGTGKLVIEPRSLKIRRVELKLGDNELNGEALLARPPAAGPIELQLRVRGQDLAELGPILGLTGLPPHPYQASGELEITPTDYGFTGLKLQVGPISASADGRLGRPPGFNGTELTIHASGPQLSELGPVVTLPELPALPFDINGGLRISSEAIELRQIRGTLGTSRLSVDGAFRPHGLPIHLALDFQAEGSEPSDLTRFLEGLGLGKMPALPSKPYAIDGYFEHDPAGSRVRQLQLSLGALEGTIDGFLGAAPGYHGTALEIRASGGNETNIEELIGRRFDVEGLRFRCTIRRREGSAGTAPAALEIRGALDADRFAIGKAEELATQERSVTGTGSAEVSGKATTQEHRAFFFPKIPFKLSLPTSLKGKIDCRFGDLVLSGTHLQGAHIGIGLDRSALHLQPIEAGLGGKGSLSGSLTLTTGKGGLAMAFKLRIDDASPALLFHTTATRVEPRLDVNIELQGSGVSPHELASAANGRFSASLTEGTIEASILDRLGDSIFLRILDALNPFRKKEKTTDLECGIVAGVVKDGEVVLDPMGLKTANVTTIAQGTIDLSTEKLSIDFASKARRGIGFSASTLTNEYIKIGGTLLKPSVQLKPLGAATKTGLAVVTAGISLLAEGLWNRISSEADICTAMAEKVDEMWKQAPPETEHAGR